VITDEIDSANILQCFVAGKPNKRKDGKNKGIPNVAPAVHAGSTSNGYNWYVVPVGARRCELLRIVGRCSPWAGCILIT
jgi:hypothetical protein